MRRCAARAAVAGLMAIGWMLGGSQHALAQFGELRPAHASYDYYGPVTVPLGSEAAIHTIRTGVTLPVELGCGSYLFPALGYQLIVPSRSESEPQAIGKVHKLSLGTGLVHPLGEDWLMTLRLEGGLASNLAGPLQSRDLYVNGAALLLYAISPMFSVGGGISYDQRTGQVLPIPVVMVSWEPSKRFAVHAAAPAAADVMWRPLDMLTLEIIGRLDGQHYNLSGGTYGDQKAALAYSLVKLGAGAVVHFTRLLHLEVTGGAVVARRFELFLDGDPAGSDYIPPAPFVGASFWLGGSGFRSDRPPRDRNAQ